MNIHIATRHVMLRRNLLNAVRETLTRTLHGFSSAITAIRVELSDRNGRRGGGDKRCRVHVTLADGRQIVQEDMRANLRLAIRRTLNGLSRRVRREVRSAAQ